MEELRPMILTGEDVLRMPIERRNAHLLRITELIRLVDPEAELLSAAYLGALNASGAAAFYCTDERIVGCGRLLIYPHLTGKWRGTMESLIVDPAFRRRGIAF